MHKNRVCTLIKLKHYRPYFPNGFNSKTDKETTTTPWSEIGFHLSTVQRCGWSEVVTFRSFRRREFRKSQKLSTKIKKDRHKYDLTCQTKLNGQWADWVTTDWLSDWQSERGLTIRMSRNLTDPRSISRSDDNNGDHHSICLKGEKKKTKYRFNEISTVNYTRTQVLHLFRHFSYSALLDDRENHPCCFCSMTVYKKFQSTSKQTNRQTNR